MIKNKIQSFADVVLVSTFPMPVSGPRSDSGTLFEAKFWLIFVFFCIAETALWFSVFFCRYSSWYKEYYVLVRPFLAAGTVP